MISEKVRRILISMDAPFTDKEMELMSDKDGWAWIYRVRPPKIKKDAKRQPEICFTGFDPLHKARLKERAEDHGFKCVTCVTKNLSFLCTGEGPGPSKLREAIERGIKIISEDEFNELII